jgi:hypothetical protein
MAQIEFVINPDTLTGLGGLIPGEQSLISPLRPGTALTPEQAAALKEKGVLDSSGEITPSCLPALETIMQAGYYSQVRLDGSGNFLECVVYFSRDYRNSTAVFTTGEGLLVRSPAPVQDIVLALKQYIGESTLQNLDFYAEIGFDEALALAALIDLRRRELLKDMAEDREPDDMGFTADVVYSEIVRESDNAQWLVTLFREMTGAGPDRGQLDKALAALEAEDLVIIADGSCRLTGRSGVLADRFLLLYNLVSLKAGREMTGGNVDQVGFVCLQSGINSILTIQTTEGNKMEMTALPAAALFRYVGLYLSDPVAIQLLIPDEPAPAALMAEETARAGGDGCPGCGKQNPADARFCLECGSPLVPKTAAQPSVCRSCGNPLNKGARFCGACGSAAQL